MLGSEAPQLQSSVFNVQQANSLTVQHCKTTIPSSTSSSSVASLAQEEQSSCSSAVLHIIPMFMLRICFLAHILFVSAGLIVEPRKEHSVIKSSCRPFGIKNSGIWRSPFRPLQMTSASVDTTQVPKIVHFAREKLEEVDLPVTGQNLFECLSKGDWDRLSWTSGFTCVKTKRSS